MPNQYPLVSVVMPAYNHERFVRQALDSVLHSGLPQIELIVRDDASSDTTSAIIHAWAELHRDDLCGFTFIEGRQNIGLCASMNELVGRTRGEIVHCMASDDYYLPGGLAAKTEAMLANPNWEYIFCDGQAVGPDGEVFKPSLVDAGTIDPARLTPSLVAEELLYHWDMPANLHSWRSRAFRSRGGEFEFDTTVFCEDLDAAWWAMSRQVLGFVPSICQAYRFRSWPQTRDINPTRLYRDVSYIHAKYARYFEPRVRNAKLNLAAAMFHNAIGDHEAADKFWQIHHESSADYKKRCDAGNGR
jgi:glycosyltransferase involved in cell wall biosynthesis